MIAAYLAWLKTKNHSLKHTSSVENFTACIANEGYRVIRLLCGENVAR